MQRILRKRFARGARRPLVDPFALSVDESQPVDLYLKKVNQAKQAMKDNKFFVTGGDSFRESLHQYKVTTVSLVGMRRMSVNAAYQFIGYVEEKIPPTILLGVANAETLRLLGGHVPEIDPFASPPASKVRTDELPARKAIKEFFTKRFIHLDNLHKLPNELIIFENDQRTKFNLGNDVLSACYNALALPNNKTLFCKPYDLLHMEHLALTLSVEHLRHLLLSSLKKFSESLQKDNNCLLLEERLLLAAFRDFAQGMYPSELYGLPHQRPVVLPRVDHRLLLQQGTERDSGDRLPPPHRNGSSSVP